MDEQADPGIQEKLTLADRLGTSREAYRTALERFSRFKFRPGLRVIRRPQGMETLPSLMSAGGAEDFAVSRSMVELRLQGTPGMAAMAAERSGPQLAGPLTELVDRMAATENMVARQKLAFSFWQTVADGTGSVVFRLIVDDLRAASEPFLETIVPVAELELRDLSGYRGVVEAIAEGNAEQTEKLTRALLEPSALALISVLRELEKP
ncbi:FadR family transcriptional regulator [Pseudonocardiaceae bacterium YIM PH 21723]|nr:FadR family transcriptional regulator [Pseudonocardiaceae bacterium YIM PH 21723]